MNRTHSAVIFAIVVIISSVECYAQIAVPSTQVASTQPIDLANGKVVDATKALSAAKTDALSRFHATQNYTVLNADRKAKEDRLNDIRKNGTMQDRLVASGEFTKVNEQIKKLEAASVKNDQSVIDATVALANCKIALSNEQFKEGQEQIEKDNAISARNEQISEGKIEVGTPIGDIKSVWGHEDSLQEESGGQQYYVFKRFVDVPKKFDATPGRYVGVTVDRGVETQSISPRNEMERKLSAILAVWAKDGVTTKVSMRSIGSD